MKNLAPAEPVSNTADAAIIKRYKDALSKWHRIAPETWKIVAAALGEPHRGSEPVLRKRKKLRGPAEITLEHGGFLRIESELPQDLPLGYHTLRYFDNGHTVRCIVTPACYLPADLNVWGWSAQVLYVTGPDSFPTNARTARERQSVYEINSVQSSYFVS